MSKSVVLSGFVEFKKKFVFPSGCCNGGGQGALVNRPPKESDFSGETAAREPKPGRAPTGAAAGGEEH